MQLSNSYDEKFQRKLHCIHLFWHDDAEESNLLFVDHLHWEK
jgi:hypothetical protein